MKLARIAACWFACGVVCTVAASGCVDLSPVAYEEPEGGGPEGGVDGPSDGPSRDALAADCLACLSTGPCMPSWTACEANSSCAAFAACMSATLCWSSTLSDLANLSPCIIQCAGAGMITSQNDPAAVLVSPLYTCAQDPAQCEHACVPGADN